MAEQLYPYHLLQPRMIQVPYPIRHSVDSVVLRQQRKHLLKTLGVQDVTDAKIAYLYCDKDCEIGAHWNNEPLCGKVN